MKQQIRWGSSSKLIKAHQSSSELTRNSRVSAGREWLEEETSQQCGKSPPGLRPSTIHHGPTIIFESHIQFLLSFGTRRALPVAPSLTKYPATQTQTLDRRVSANHDSDGFTGDYASLLDILKLTVCPVSTLRWSKSYTPIRHGARTVPIWQSDPPETYSRAGRLPMTSGSHSPPHLTSWAGSLVSCLETKFPLCPQPPRRGPQLDSPLIHGVREWGRISLGMSTIRLFSSSLPSVRG